MNLTENTKDILRSYRISLKKRLGQVFAVDSVFLETLASYASLTRDDIVLEVGSGLGFLTKVLLNKCKKVVAVEVDPRLTRVLKDQLGDSQNVELIEGDIFKIHLPYFNKVVSAPPYYLSSPLLFFLLEKGFECAVLALQEEFADRLVASVGRKDYSRLSVMIYYRSNAEVLNSVSRCCFYPQPEVDSVIVRLRPRKPPFSLLDEETFFELTRILFSQRNKKVRNAIIPFLRKPKTKKDDARKIADSILFHDKRVQELKPEDFGALANELVRKEIVLQQ
jgi:16S rRNA (adenine1518-N6/adenine1519-N6)-dimethyltransferase